MINLFTIRVFRVECSILFIFYSLLFFIFIQDFCYFDLLLIVKFDDLISTQKEKKVASISPNSPFDIIHVKKFYSKTLLTTELWINIFVLSENFC